MNRDCKEGEGEEWVASEEGAEVIEEPRAEEAGEEGGDEDGGVGETEGSKRDGEEVGERGMSHGEIEEGKGGGLGLENGTGGDDGAFEGEELEFGVEELANEKVDCPEGEEDEGEGEEVGAHCGAEVGWRAGAEWE